MIFANWLRGPTLALSEAETAEVKELCTSVVKNIQLLGRRASAFSQTPLDVPKNIHQRILWMKAYREVLAAQAAEGTTAKVEKELMWKFFAKMRLAPTSDTFDLVGDDDYIEIYDLAGDQMYRSLNYFDIVSLTVEDLLHLNWKRDFKRSTKVSIGLLSLTALIFAGQLRKTFDCANVPVHRVSEKIAGRYLFELNIKYVSPLSQNGKCVAIVVVSKARRLSPA